MAVSRRRRGLATPTRTTEVIARMAAPIMGATPRIPTQEAVTKMVRLIVLVFISPFKIISNEYIESSACYRIRCRNFLLGSGRNSMSRYATIETDELRRPLSKGWRRETVVREYSKSGVRGDVVYYAPCGKKFKQYPDIMRVRSKKQ